MKKLLLSLLFLPVLLWSNNLKAQCPVDVDNVSCHGDEDGSATITPTGGSPPYTFLWSDGQTTQNATGLVAGQYTVEVFDVNGTIICNDTFTVYQPLIIKSSLTFIISPPSAIGLCDGSLTASVNGGTPPYTFSWSPCTSSLLIAGGLCANETCCVSVTDASGCSTVGCETIPNVIAGIHDDSETNKKTLLKINNIFGQLTKRTKNELLFYIYEDGTIEKKIIIE